MRKVFRIITLSFIRATMLSKSDGISKFSYIWWIFEPLFMISTYFVVFNVILGTQNSSFVTNLVVGVVVWNWFSNVIHHSMMAICDNIHLINQVNINKLSLPLTVCFMNLFKQIPVFLVMFAYLGFMRGVIFITLPSFFLLMILQFFVSFSIGLFLASILPFYRDLRIPISSAMMLLMFLSGIFYTIDMVPEGVRWLFKLNPIALLIHEYRDTLLNGSLIGYESILYLSSVSLIFFLIGRSIVNHFENLYPKLI